MVRASLAIFTVIVGVVVGKMLKQHGAIDDHDPREELKQQKLELAKAAEEREMSAHEAGEKTAALSSAAELAAQQLAQAQALVKTAEEEAHKSKLEQEEAERVAAENAKAAEHAKREAIERVQREESELHKAKDEAAHALTLTANDEHVKRDLKMESEREYEASQKALKDAQDHENKMADEVKAQQAAVAEADKRQEAAQSMFKKAQEARTRVMYEDKKYALAQGAEATQSIALYLTKAAQTSTDPIDDLDQRKHAAWKESAMKTSASNEGELKRRAAGEAANAALEKVELLKAEAAKAKALEVGSTEEAIKEAEELELAKKRAIEATSKEELVLQKAEEVAKTELDTAEAQTKAAEEALAAAEKRHAQAAAEVKNQEEISSEARKRYYSGRAQFEESEQANQHASAAAEASLKRLEKSHHDNADMLKHVNAELGPDGKSQFRNHKSEEKPQSNEEPHSNPEAASETMQPRVTLEVVPVPRLVSPATAQHAAEELMDTEAAERLWRGGSETGSVPLRDTTKGKPIRNVQVLALQNAGGDLLTQLLRATFGKQLSYYSERNEDEKENAAHGLEKHVNLKALYEGEPMLLKQLDDAKVHPIMIVRNPFSWLQAMREHPGDLEDCILGNTWLTRVCDVEKPCGKDINVPKVSFPNVEHVWNNWVEAYQRAGLFGFSHSLILTYEDIIQRPAEAMRRIGKYIGLEAPSEDISLPNSKGPKQSAIEFDQEKTYLKSFNDEEKKQACSQFNHDLLVDFGYTEDCP